MFKKACLIILTQLIITGIVLALPGQINYQGVLTDTDGNSLNGDYQMTFTIYDAASGGNSLWSETQTVSLERSEERRVGKECRSRWSP